MTIFRSNTALLSLLMLAACGQRVSDSGLICDPSPGFIAKDVGANSDEQSEIVQMCLHKFGYRYARAEGSNREIADAVVGRCRAGINRVLQYKRDESLKSQNPLTDEDAKALEFGFEEQALRRVVEGRAGKCEIRGEDQK